jgi:tetratricopeptide (TPR) repeat protein
MLIDHILAIFREQRLINRLEHIFDGLAIAPDNPFLLDLRKNAINYFLTNSRDKNVEHEVDILLEKRPEMAMAWIFKSWFLVVTNELDAAENAIRTALYYEPENALGHYTIGNVHLIRKEYEMAIREYSRAFEHAPDMFEAVSNIARAYEMQGNIGMAVQYYEKALQLNPGLTQIQQRLAALRAHLPEKKSGK